MITISGYELGEKIHESERSLVYRGKRESDGAPIIIKVLQKDHPTPDETARFKREYEITRGLPDNLVVTPFAVTRFKSRLALLMNDFGGIRLGVYMAGRPLPVDEFLSLSIQITSVLAEIHRRNIIHKDINPSNIVINPSTRQVKLIDFGISTALSRENPTVRNPNVLEGTLGYMSPEQTGRMNRSMDYRTDFYSLGVTFYEMLTGRMPFYAADAVELVHAHIAKEPAPPFEVNPAVPQAISDIVMKLLSKTAEDRYQSAYGLCADLEECFAKWKATGRIDDFSPARRDVSDKFQIPQKLYGREAEIEVLLETFDRVSRGKAEMMLVAGYSGVGKSALVNEIQKPIGQKRGYFIAGKFDQLHRDIPYASLIQAFQDLVRQLLTETEERLSEWRRKLAEALGPNGQLIIDVIPEVELILGKQPHILTLAPAESQNRFHFVFQSFVRAVAGEDHPLVIFLDDLQWADAPSLKLIQLLVTDSETRSLLIIGAYRDNEVAEAHPLLLTLEALKKAGSAVTTLLLSPLDLAHIDHLIDDTLKCGRDRAAPLGALLLEKTNGNPFFLNQFLKSLYDEKLLEFEPVRGEWRWDLDEIKNRGITDNVVELMASKIQKLPRGTQHVLMLAACIGSHFELSTLAIVNERSEVETAAGLWTALQEGLVLPTGETYSLAQPLSVDMTVAEVPDVSYRFLHDRVQQAAYSLIERGSRDAIHLKVGRLLLLNTPKEEVEEHVFDILNQLNTGAALIDSKRERYAVARLNLVAAKKAKCSAAYEPALRYVTAGLNLLPDDAWEEEYELTFALHVEGIELEYLNTDFERAGALSDVALARAKTALEKAKIYETLMLSHTARNAIGATITTAMKALELLGVPLPPGETVDAARVGQALAATAAILSGRRAKDLADLPEMTDPNKLAAMRVLSVLCAPVYIASPSSFPLVVCELVNLSVMCGNSPLSPYGYVLYALIQIGVLGDIDAGYEYSELALTLMDRGSAREIRSKVYLVAGGFVRHWKVPVREVLDQLLESLKCGLEAGDIEYACYGGIHYSSAIFHLGEPLDAVLKEHARYIDLVTRFKQDFQRHYVCILRQTVLCLIGRAADPARLVGESFNEDETLPALLEMKNTMSVCTTYICKSMLSYFFGSFAEAAAHADMAELYLNGILGQVTVVQQNFFQSMAHLARLAALPKEDAGYEEERARTLIKVDKNIAALAHWSAHAPENRTHKLRLVEAERALAAGDTLAAMERFEQAIQGAARCGFVYDEALAYERAAEMYLAIGNEKIAEVYLMEARYAYVRWGAAAKVTALEKRFPRTLGQRSAALGPVIREALSMSASTGESGTASGAAVLDFPTVMKAARTISGEIVLERLIDKLMQIVIENAGAQRGLYLLERDGKLIVEVERAVGREAAFRPGSPVEESGDLLSTSIVNYVARTKESVVLHDAAREGLFTSDPYVAKKLPRSVLCAPVENQGKLVAIIYLENNLTASAFTSDRLEVLRMLSAQAALSIHNASLYGDLARTTERLKVTNEELAVYSSTLEQKVEERTRELRDKNEELGNTLKKLKDTQQQLVTSEKLASLGALTAGIAHEIRNPLNFVNNFAELSVGLLNDLEEIMSAQEGKIDDDAQADVKDTIEYLRQNVAKINEHGKRANSIVNGMLLHSRNSAGKREKANLNALVSEAVNLAYHGLRAKDTSFNISITSDYDDTIADVDMVSAEITRVILNVVNNACYAAHQRKRAAGAEFAPKLSVKTKDRGGSVEVRIRDNGTGIPPGVVDKIFNPFFTTKPPGEGTGLGLSMSYDIIVQGHKGEMRVDTAPGEYTEFIIVLPKPTGR